MAQTGGSVRGELDEGLQVGEALVKDGGKLGDCKEALVPYDTNEGTSDLITEAANPTRTLLKEPAVSGGGQ